jgi:hypothetical protein
VVASPADLAYQDQVNAGTRDTTHHNATTTALFYGRAAADDPADTPATDGRTHE